MRLNELFAEADPKDLGNMNDKMRNVLSKVHSDDEGAKQAAKDKAEQDRQAKAKELGPNAMADYEKMLKSHDWTYDYSDDHRVWQRGNEQAKAIRRMADILDPDRKIYNKYSPFKNMEESATAGATSAGNIASVDAPHISPGKARGKKSYTGTPGKSGTKAPPQPKIIQPKNPDGSAKGAQTGKLAGVSLFGGPAIKR